MKKSLILLNIIVIALFFSCDGNDKSKAKVKRVPIERHQPKSVAYQFENAKEWLSVNIKDSKKMRIVTSVNRIQGIKLFPITVNRMCHIKSGCMVIHIIMF